MTVSLTEHVDSRRSSTGENGETELVYILSGTSDEVTARTLVESSTATTYDGKTRQSIALKPISVDSVAGTGTWEATIRYGMAPAAPETGQRRSLCSKSERFLREPCGR
jgi:hypothetical protein